MTAPHSLMSRRSFLACSSALTLISTVAVADTSPDAKFTRDDVIIKARALAQNAYELRPMVPQDWLDISYDQYKNRWFRVKDALWADTDRSYNVDFFLPGLYFPRAIQINTVTDGLSARVPFDLSLFQKGDIAPELSTDGNLGYSGLRLRTEQPGAPVKQKLKKTEFSVFQGASYFRAIANWCAYGLSARGLALKTADSEGEEFPEFIEFWLEAPGANQKNIIVHALMDSPSVTGAYRFDISPGDNCVMEVEVTLFAREELSHVGIAPLTSMFLYDDTNRARFDDFRPAVHDSEGLLIKNGNGEILWRPLANPQRLQISSFLDKNPNGFGLMQRSRKLSDFADLEANYHLRPSAWVEPKQDWGKGAITLVEIPADKEIYDNIVAYWRPETPYPAGAEVDLSYRLTWGHEPDMGLAVVGNTASGAKVFGPPGRLMKIDYDAHPLLEGDPDDYEIFISSPHVETTKGILQRNPETGGLRLAFSFDPKDLDIIELRAQLRRDGAPATEVWLYRWSR